MTIENKIITNAIIISGLKNMAVLIFSKFFINSTIPKFEPAVTSNCGLLMTVLWGLAYISVAKYHNNVKWLIAAFDIEKPI